MLVLSIVGTLQFTEALRGLLLVIEVWLLIIVNAHVNEEGDQ